MGMPKKSAALGRCDHLVGDGAGALYWVPSSSNLCFRLRVGVAVAVSLWRGPVIGVYVGRCCAAPCLWFGEGGIKSLGWDFGRFTGACSLVGDGARFWCPLEFDWLAVAGGPPVVS